MNIKNGLMYEKNGWKYISIKGEPKERGYAYGYLCAKDFKEIQTMLNFLMYESYGKKWEYFIEEINSDFKEMTKSDFPELYEEMEGIAEGCCANGTETTIDEIIAWNFYMSIPYWYSTKSESRIQKEGGAKDHCSAFIAVGDWTEDGKIVCAHNSFTDFVSTIIHEYIHYTQSVRMYFRYIDKYNKTYDNHPYEKQADDISKRDARLCIKEVFLSNGKKIKEKN